MREQGESEEDLQKLFSFRDVLDQAAMVNETELNEMLEGLEAKIKQSKPNKYLQ